MLASRLLENAASWDIDRWRAELDVRLGIRAGKTRLLAASHRGPLRVQRVFHPEGDGSAHLVLLHPPAGLVGGDALHVRAHVEAQASALLTTTGAGKAYRSAGRLASTLCGLVDCMAFETGVFGLQPIFIHPSDAARRLHYACRSDIEQGPRWGNTDFAGCCVSRFSCV